VIFYRWAMRVGSQILFWLSVLIVLLSILNVYDTLQQTRTQMGVGFEGLRTLTRFKILLSAVGQSLLLGAVPFGAAVIIHRIDRFLAMREEAAE
jgi:hypothetical protein